MNLPNILVLRSFVYSIRINSTHLGILPGGTHFARMFSLLNDPSLLEQIFLNIPAFELFANCRWVCKLWNELIDNSAVLKWHTWRSEPAEPPRSLRLSVDAQGERPEWSTKDCDFAFSPLLVQRIKEIWDYFVKETVRCHEAGDSIQDIKGPERLFHIPEMFTRAICRPGPLPNMRLALGIRDGRSHGLGSPSSPQRVSRRWIAPQVETSWLDSFDSISDSRVFRHICKRFFGGARVQWKILHERYCRDQTPLEYQEWLRERDQQHDELWYSFVITLAYSPAETKPWVLTGSWDFQVCCHYVEPYEIILQDERRFYSFEMDEDEVL